MRVSESIVPVSDFKAQASEWLRRVGESGQPLVITQHGKPAGVLLSPQAFDELMAQAHFVASVEEGLADAEAGRLHSHSEVVAEMKRRFRGPSSK
ncbi:type II toxin-antitoxin system Phd/YefM family antitoxin [Hyalangium gracile]|uniref:type II toxin-antitoxin system Phd/YefM family antitoxin n=1 Tax=Hyalangium gracile TaxID=394092 RepID=UPI001CCA2516|nr:type II toxin-antitoxin system Phd/YefM family antitoxin [Hyalangium gracile]